MRKKGLAGILSLLICIAIVGVGFASWVITVDKSAEATGNITVDTIEDKSHVVTVESGNLNVIFGAKAKSNPEATKNWMTYGNTSSKDEALEVTITVTVTNYNDLDTNTPFTFTLAEDATNFYSAAVTAGYVTTLDSVKSSIYVSGASKIEETTTAKYTIKLTFAWGVHFGSKNPIDFYNQYEPTATLPESSITYQQDAINSLGSDAFKNLNSIALKLTIAPNVKAA